MKQNWKKYLLTFGFSLVLMIVISPLRGYVGFVEPIALSFVCFMILTLWLLKKYTTTLPSWAIVLTIIVGAIIIDIPLRIYDYQSTEITLPDFLFRILTPLVAWAVWVIKSKIGKTAILLVASALCVWFVFYGWNYWTNKVNYGTYTGVVEQPQSDTLIFQTSTGDTTTLADLGGRYVVLDFFSSTCGACFRAMPKVQELYDRYKLIDKVKIYNVHCRNAKRNETFATGEELLKEDGYSIPCLSTDLGDPTLMQLVSCYPTVLVYDQRTKQFILRSGIQQTADLLDKLL